MTEVVAAWLYRLLIDWGGAFALVPLLLLMVMALGCVLGLLLLREPARDWPLTEPVERMPHLGRYAP